MEFQRSVNCVPELGVWMWRMKVKFILQSQWKHLFLLTLLK